MGGETATTGRVAAPRTDALALWSLLAAGLVIRLVLAFMTDGVEFDIDSFGVVARARDDLDLDLYSEVDAGGPVPRWPYPPGYIPWIEVAQQIDSRLGLPFDAIIRLPSILADLAIAWIVHEHLRWRGAGAPTRLLAAGAVALGPMFVLVSGFHGQIDGAAILPAVAAVVLWEQARTRMSRALAAGLLIGAGAAVKTVPFLVVFALLPTARSWRERAVLVGTAAAIPIVLLAPFALADTDGVRNALSYVGRPGLGGLSLLLQPGLVAEWFSTQQFDLNAANAWLRDHAGAVNGAAVLLAALVAWRRRLRPVEAAALVWLAVFLLGANWFPWYAVWGLPFLLMASVRWGIVFQLVLTVPATLVYFGGDWLERPQLVYVPAMVVAAALCIASAVALARGRAA